MATIDERKNSDGTRSYVAQVRIKPFQPASKTFAERDYAGSRKEARHAAGRWAEELEKTLREQRARGGVRSDVASLTLRQLVDEYMADPETRKLATADERHRQLAWWIQRYGTMKAIEFPSPVLLRAAREALSAAFEPGTVNRYLAAARACINFGRATGLLPPNLVWPPRLMLTEPKARERYLTDEELSRVLAKAREDSPLMFAAVMFAVGVGCRQSELLRVRWGDIDEASHTVAVRVTKTATSRRAHCPPAVSEALQGLLAENVHPLPGRYAFADQAGEPLKAHVLIDRWEKLRKAAGVPDVRWHDLRHASASFLVQGGATLAEVAHQLGHLNVATSKRYAHLVPGAKPTGADALNARLGKR
ncbi:MAG: tyrosine-type recombinase/integrase [Steroidobacteraceae bacterium]